MGVGEARADNPFGVMLWPNGEDLSLLLARAKGLGIAWYRPPAVFADRWQAGAPCPACSLYQRSGLSIALTVRNTGRDAGTRLPSHPPADLGQYKKSLTAILEAWKPDLLVVEDEENTPALFTDPSPDHHAYAQQLEAACSVAHTQKVACTNGGLSSGSAAALVWLDFLGRNMPDEACDFAKGVFYTEDDPQAGLALCQYKKLASVPADIKSQLLQGADHLLAIYKASAMDAVNIHWYIHDARALALSIDILQRLSGKPVISNEMGQLRWDADPTRVRPLLRAAFAANMKVAIWYSIDSTRNVSLFDQEGRLRPNGWEFQRQMRGR